MTGDWLDKAAAAIGPRLDEFVANGGTPGAVVTMGAAGESRTITRGAIAPGWVDLPPSEIVRFDIASLTKIVATWAAVGQTDEIDLDEPVGTYFDEPSLPGSGVTVRQILSHTSGLMPATRFDRYIGTEQELATLLLSEPLESPPGTSYRYINRGFILLGLLLERTFKRPLDLLVTERVWRPWSMEDTGYGPLPASPTVAPTEMKLRGTRPLWGVVHDENAGHMGGVAGHAGVFSTARDLATFCQRILNRRWDEGFDRYVRESTRVHAGGGGEHRGLAWLLSEDGRTMYHHGFTGGSLFVFQHRPAYAVLLSNAVHNSRERRGLSALRAGIRALAEL
ncbi:serine hydrolase domain-containing protein [Streptosporangium sp. KLBMP 9127]|nr:beta-lactamase family protein [Streptosporangium sp. KLBMP 9127]